MKRMMAVFALTAGVLAGCQNLPGEWPQQRLPDTEAGTVATALETVRGSQGLSGDALRQRMARQLENRTDGHCDAAELSAGMLALRLPGDAEPPAIDTLFDDCLDAAATADTAAGVLAAVIADGLHWRGEAAAGNAGNKGLKKALEELRAENAQLRDQLEGLKAIEESLQQREQQRNGTQ
ncbi:hypothetical protein KBTX_01205 [wastewater metagenome]|uniref:Lipoprotein n=2 Tax=unclassified sequences TaxID=12908 RepID=A0A5B8RDT2_9ZZZZ|nr:MULTISPECIES: hypothetical protein [Arhodomonas]MCS4504173.1 hypothetical protein [Arhodomonas aquaeolei]QEA04887.1 hypothetical protein KBTEX_01205 [uncultured organism]